MSLPLKADHGENGLALSSLEWSVQEVVVWFNYYTHRSIGVSRPAALDGVFKFRSADPFPVPPGFLSAPPWDGDPSQPRDLGRCDTDIFELSDIAPRATDAVLRTAQDVPWTWALPEHKIRLILGGIWTVDFTVSFRVPVPPIRLDGTWTLVQDFR